jgi:hypothetical protein
MNTESFVAALVEGVHRASVSDTLETLADGPGGRRPPLRLVQLSQWYRSLPPEDQTRLAQVVEQAVHATLFGTLCVLDGVRTVAPATEFELFASTAERRERLNSLHGIALHDEYQAQVYEQVFGA